MNYQKIAKKTKNHCKNERIILQPKQLSYHKIIKFYTMKCNSNKIN